MKKVNHQQLGELVNIYYKKKISLFVWGTFGIGKSRVVRIQAENIAKEKNKEFVEWNKCSAEKKEEMFKQPSKYFVFMDIRLAEFDSSDIKGLPDFKPDRNSVEWKIPYWCKYLEHPESDGILFLDEMNLTVPIVLSASYKLILDRQVNDGTIAKEWGIVGGGNLATDKAYTTDIPNPLKDRAGECELISPSAEHWVDNFAIPNNIDTRIIGFVLSKPSVLHDINEQSEMKSTTERGWGDRLNTLIEGINDYNKLDLVCGTAIGEGIAREFLAFCKIKEKLNIDEIIKNPEKLKEIDEIDIKYFLTTALAEKYSNKKLDFDNMMKISQVFDVMGNCEFVALLWRLCFKYNKKRFSDDFYTKDKDNPLRAKYKGYLVD